jgi:hypothetical protein
MILLYCWFLAAMYAIPNKAASPQAPYKAGHRGNTYYRSKKRAGCRNRQSRWPLTEKPLTQILIFYYAQTTQWPEHHAIIARTNNRRKITIKNMRDRLSYFN